MNIETITISAIIITVAVIVCKALLSFSERAHRAEIKMMRNEEEFNIAIRDQRIGWMSHDIEILTSDRFSNDEKRVVMHKYEKERKRKEQLMEKLFLKNAGNALTQQAIDQNRKNQNKQI